MENNLIVEPNINGRVEDTIVSERSLNNFLPQDKTKPGIKMTGRNKLTLSFTPHKIDYKLWKIMHLLAHALYVRDYEFYWRARQ